ncbi:hypothetical protein EDD18DRAFT_1356756 [Armillaria luteobubalina]|uniref:Uncharacterized protein n=1 Tax=Armillaria luteobubalina TaxID=153913 RepID=A0AA39UQS7_9AGAR|nr:hypothetical protein EDD18DRAFT_1356756 [Armillaria luteobubalina]
MDHHDTRPSQSSEAADAAHLHSDVEAKGLDKKPSIVVRRRRDQTYFEGFGATVPRSGELFVWLLQAGDLEKCPDLAAYTSTKGQISTWKYLFFFYDSDNVIGQSFPRRPSIAKHAGGTTRFLRQFSENLQGYCGRTAHRPRAQVSSFITVLTAALVKAVTANYVVPESATCVPLHMSSALLLSGLAILLFSPGIKVVWLVSITLIKVDAAYVAAPIITLQLSFSFP